METSKHNPNFGALYCPYVAFRPYNDEEQGRRVREHRKASRRKSHKLPSILKNASALSQGGYTEIHRLHLGKKVSKKGLKHTLGIR